LEIIMSLPIEAGTWALDTWHTQLGFAVRHLGISTVRGLFKSYDGSVVVDGSGAKIDVWAELTSVETGNPGRDQHLQGADFFDSANHPKLTFTSTAIDTAAGTITGDLTIKGVTKPITLNTTFNGTGTFPMDQSFHAGFVATGSFNRSDFGVSYGVPLVSDSVELTLDVQLVKQA
jgi:polyisoprenoid-binding protein YceI